MKKLLLTVVVAILASSSWAVVGTIKAKGDTKRGEIKWNASSKSYSLMLKKGKTAYEAQFSIADVESIEIDKPANFDKLVDLIAKGNGSAAEKDLLAILKTYKMLQWDKIAARYLVELYIQMNQYNKAYELVQGILKTDREAAYKGELAPAYWQILLALNKDSQLENCLSKAAMTGDRVSSAEALLMRGDVIIKKGQDSAEANKKALVDAYLRVALMYNDAPCVAVRAKSMQKCAVAFEKVGMPDYANKMRSSANALLQ